MYLASHLGFDDFSLLDCGFRRFEVGPSLARSQTKQTSVRYTLPRRFDGDAVFGCFLATCDVYRLLGKCVDVVSGLDMTSDLLTAKLMSSVPVERRSSDRTLCQRSSYFTVFSSVDVVPRARYSFQACLLRHNLTA